MFNANNLFFQPYIAFHFDPFLIIIDSLPICYYIHNKIAHGLNFAFINFVRIDIQKILRGQKLLARGGNKWDKTYIIID